MGELSSQLKIEKLYDVLYEISDRRGWGEKDHASIHYPNKLYIQVDMDEFLIIRNLLPKYNNSYETIAELMFDRIRAELLLTPFTPPYSYDTFKGIEIKFFDKTNGKMYKKFVL